MSELQELQKLKERVKVIENEKIRAETESSSIDAQILEIGEEIKKLGYNPETLDEDIKKLAEKVREKKEEFEKEIAKIEEKLKENA